MRWAAPEAELPGEIGKAVPSARTIPSSVIAYVIVSKRQDTGGQRDKMGE